MKYYIFLIFSSLLTAISFACKKKYNKYAKDGLINVFLFVVGYSFISAVILLPFVGKNWSMSLVCLWIAIGQSAAVMITQCLSIRCCMLGDLLIMTMFECLGATIIPFLLGTIFFNEPATILKIMGVVVMVIALALPSVFALTKEKQKTNKLYWILSTILFFTNGIAGGIAVFKVHYAPQVTSALFSSISNAIIGLIALVIVAILFFRNRTPKNTTAIENIQTTSLNDGLVREDEIATRKLKIAKIIAMIFVFLYAATICFGDYLALLALNGLPLSVRSPASMGLIMVFIALVDFVVFKEKLKIVNIVSMVVAIGGVVMISL